MARVLDLNSDGVYVPFSFSSTLGYGITHEEHKAIIKLFKGEPLERGRKLANLFARSKELDELRKEHDELRKECEDLRNALKAREQLITAAYLVIETDDKG